jgi:hypothetical protein
MGFSVNGLSASWMKKDPVTPNTLDITNEIRNIHRSFLLTCRFGALLRPVGTIPRPRGWHIGRWKLATINGASRNGVGIGCTSGDGKVSTNDHCQLSRRRIQFVLLEEDWRDLG